jgi:hypothetical protein
MAVQICRSTGTRIGNKFKRRKAENQENEKEEVGETAVANRVFIKLCAKLAFLLGR